MKNKFDFSMYANSWKLYKNSFDRLFFFALSLAVLFVASFALYSIIGNYDLGISGICLFAFGLVPLFFSYQLVIAKVSSGKDVSYNEMYYTYKNYYSPQNRGTYSVFVNLAIAIIVGAVSVYLGLVLYDFIFPDLIENAFAENTDADAMITAVINLPYILYFIVGFSVVPYLFFFKGIRKNFMIPYFNLTIALNAVLSHKICKKLREKNKDLIRKYSFYPALFFDLAFVIGYFTAGGLTIALAKDSFFLEYIFIIALSGGLLLSSVFIPPLLITDCFIADKLHPSYIILLRDEVIAMANSMQENPSMDEEQKQQIDNFLSAFKKQVEDEEKREDEINKSESPDEDPPSDDSSDNDNE